MKSEKLIQDVAIIGLGYVGEPLMRACLNAGIKTFGIDLNPTRLEQLNALSADGRNQPVLGSDWGVIAGVDVIVICVPTPVDEHRKPDYSHVISSTLEVGRNLSPTKHQLVILESTVAPGTTGGRVKDALESQSGLTAGRDFSIAFSPERIDPKNNSYALENTPKVVGGLTETCTNFATLFYENFVSDVVRASGLEEAEASKILENTYRHINIALINEFADICQGLDIDVREVVRLAATKPFGFQKFLPSIGAGGHCIPVDPNYLQDLAMTELGYGSLMIRSASEINDKRPKQVAQRVIDALKTLKTTGSSKAKILILGLSYKPDVGDFRESKQVELVIELSNLGFKPRMHDPFMLSQPDFGIWVGADELGTEIDSADLVVIAQAHSEYLQGPWIARAASKLFNATGETIPSAWRI